jgi:Rieske Fe-S protein
MNWGRPRSVPLYRGQGNAAKGNINEQGAFVTQEANQNSLATRRGVLAGVGLVGLAGAITACGASSSTAAGTNSTVGGSPTAAAVPSVSGTSSATSGGTVVGAAAALSTTSAIPVGGGKIFDTQLVVVTQPTAGEFKAFSAVCTHMGCTVNQISGGKIECPCHGSEYSIASGDVLRGPAPKPLAAKSIKVSGDSIFLE